MDKMCTQPLDIFTNQDRQVDKLTKNDELMGKTVCVHCGQAGQQADKWTNEQKSPHIDNVVHMAVDRCDHKCGKLYKVNK